MSPSTKRYIWVAILGGFVLTIVWPRPSGNGPRVGPWQGETAQGLPVRFIVDEGEDGLVIEEWSSVSDVECEGSGQTLRVEVFLDLSIPLGDEQFSLRHESDMFWALSQGSFVGQVQGSGRFTFVMPILTGHVIDELEVDKCEVLGARWTARPGRDEESSVEPSVDLVVRIGQDGACRVDAAKGR